MDPLSVLASSLAIAGATAATLKTIRLVHSAGDDLKLLISEVDGLEAVLRATDKALLRRRNSPLLPQDAIEEIRDYATSAGEKLGELNTLVKDKLIKGQRSDGDVKVAYGAWLKERGHIRGLQQDLGEVRTVLPMLLAASHLSDFSHVYTRLDQVVTSQESHTQKIDTISRAVMQIRRASDSSTSSEESDSSNTSEGLTLSPTTSIESEEETDDKQHGFLIAHHMEQYKSPTIPRKHRLESYTNPRIRAATYRQTRCRDWCSCVCHKIRTVHTPKVICSLFGFLSLSYSGVSVWSSNCSERCHGQSIPTLKAAYFFPTWFIERAIHFMVSLSYMNGLQVALTTPRTVPGDAPIFKFAIQGDREGVQTLFSQGLASPYDIAQSTGRTVLHHAVTYNHLELCQFLIDTGASPNVEDKDRETTVSLAWTRIFGNLFSPTSVSTWRTMFDSEEYLESRMFPPLNKIVLHLHGANLRQQLELSTSSINNTDAEGRTALSWAASRGDLESVKTLLDFRADPNVSSHRRQSPLHFPPQNEFSKTGEIMLQLLMAGADVNRVDSHKRTPLIYGACNQRTIANLKPLFDHGADPNAQDIHERTPLSYATRMKRIETLPFLLDNGCDPSIPDNWGITPLMEALQQNWHDGLKVLLNSPKATSNEKTKSKTAVLDEIAIRADAEMMRILADHCAIHGALEGFEDDIPVRDLFNGRESLDGETRQNFERFIALQGLGAAGIGNNDNEDEDVASEEFIDAVEYINVGDESPNI